VPSFSRIVDTPKHRPRDAFATNQIDRNTTIGELNRSLGDNINTHRTRLDKLEVDKENRAPGSMAQVGKKTANITPGRPKKKDNQFFDIGKVGR
jgi:hypothetical protein